MRGFRNGKELYISEAVERVHRGRILHVGCTNSPSTMARVETGTLLHMKICDVARNNETKVVGIDIDQAAIDFLQTKMPDEEIFLLDAHELASNFSNEQRFDMIIAGDVIEHLSNPGKFLSSCREVLKEEGVLIITTVNAFGIVRFLKSFLNHEAVHSEHTAYYSGKTLSRLLWMSNMTCERFGYYSCEPIGRLEWNRAVSNIVENCACAIWPQLSEGVVIEAKKIVLV